MKLGIAVVYMVSEENEKLLDLHFNQIEQYTPMPYTIYASVNRLLPQFLERLEEHPRVKICPCPTTALRGAEEHSYYLDQLVKMAIEDGVSHVATFHVDSFPIRSGWVEELAEKLSETCVLAAIMRVEVSDRKPSPACLFFHREFYLTYRPTFLLSPQECSSAPYERYRREVEHLPDSGFGYGFTVYSEGLSWYPLMRSNKGEDHDVIGSIYEDCIFHLGAALEFTSKDRHPGKAHLGAHTASKAYSIILPYVSRMKRMMKGMTPRLVRRMIAPVNHAIAQRSYEHVRSHLLEGPASYLHYLRTGKR